MLPDQHLDKNGETVGNLELAQDTAPPDQVFSVKEIYLPKRDKGQRNKRKKTGDRVREEQGKGAREKGRDVCFGAGQRTASGQKGNRRGT